MALPQIEVHTINPNLVFIKFFGIMAAISIPFYIMCLIFDLNSLIAIFLGVAGAGIWYWYHGRYNPGAMKFYIRYVRIPNYLPGNKIKNHVINEVEIEW